MSGIPALFPASSRCTECPIRHRAVCALCEAEELQELERIKSYRTYATGETIAWAGEKLSLVGTVIEGVVTLSSTLADGRRQMVGLLFPSDFLGRPGRSEFAYDAVAATPVTLCMFRKAEFERLVARTPQIGRRLLEMTLDELDAAREWMLLLGRKTAREKVASLFVIMARRDAGAKAEQRGGVLRVPLHITRESMSDYLGLTIETVSRQISALKKDGVIRLTGNRAVDVPDLPRLVRESGSDPLVLAGG